MIRKAALALFSLVAAARSRPRTERDRPELSRYPQAELDTLDGAVIAQLRKNGADLSKPTDMVHYLSVPARADAEDAARRLNAAGYRAEVREPLGTLSDGRTDSRYPVVAHVDTVPSMKTVVKARAFFDSLARDYRGEYDGWEAAITK